GRLSHPSRFLVLPNAIDSPVSAGPTQIPLCALFTTHAQGDKEYSGLRALAEGAASILKN
ncbi:MAG TPA: hypothetical protein VFJ56_06050, partial [Nitrospira sp.]|nr:hypothetical protein [Nitrospira sp.]